jgi:hypothetical protein
MAGIAAKKSAKASWRRAIREMELTLFIHFLAKRSGKAISCANLLRVLLHHFSLTSETRFRRAPLLKFVTELGY